METVGEAGPRHRPQHPRNIPHSYVLAHEVVVWRPSTWNAGADAAPAVYGFFAAFFVWLGFIVPILLNGVAFERKSWKVFGIGAGYQALSLVAMAMILSFWRA